MNDRLTLSGVVGRKVLWDKRKSNAAKGDFWAPCPFHQEKTPSFHVDDRKGVYYCFGCQAKGNAITFVKETENVSFIEAVEILAREAGIPMPEQRHDPKAAERKDRLTRLAEVMEQAVQLYGLAFRSAAGQGAREYAARRGLTAATLKRFEIGYAPDARHHQTEFFKDKGVLDEAVAAGLLIRPDDGGAPYDRFRGRLMFPIRDVRGRCIAFGGRALDPGAQAKYLNSPETELFHKGRTLYNHGPAREAAGKSGGKPGAKPAGLIVAEGYMDVIALVSAGFDHAVAPLGTAVTEEQLALMWRMADEPVIALDGDQAGQRAAERLVHVYRGVGQSETLFLGSGAKQDCAHAGCQAYADGRYVRTNKVHCVENRQAGADYAARGINVQADVPFRVLPVQEQQLGYDRVGHVVNDWRTQEYDSLLEQQ